MLHWANHRWAEFVIYFSLLVSEIIRPGVSSCPLGCKISPYNSKVCIEQNLVISKNVALVEAIKT